MREKPENAALKSLTLKEFTGLIFNKVRWGWQSGSQPQPAAASRSARRQAPCHSPAEGLTTPTPLPWRPPPAARPQVPGLKPFRGSLEEIYDSFNKYKRTVPVR